MKKAKSLLFKVAIATSAFALNLAAVNKVAAEEVEELDEEFLEFLMEFEHDGEWIDPTEIEKWDDRDLKKERREQNPQEEKIKS